MLKLRSSKLLAYFFSMTSLVALPLSLNATPPSNPTLLIGKVFHDKNGDGLQNQQEEGVPGIRLATVTGLMLETDGYGRFHIAENRLKKGNKGSTKGRNFILKVDNASLPQGAYLTTENPRVISGSHTTINKINFGVQF